MAMRINMRWMAALVLASGFALASPATPVAAADAVKVRPTPTPPTGELRRVAQGPIEALDTEEQTITVEGVLMKAADEKVSEQLEELAVGDLVSVTYLGRDEAVEIELLDDL